MKTFDYTITDSVGLHIRPAGKLVALAKTFESAVTVSGNGKQVDCKRMVALMSLGIKHGDAVTVSVDGADEEAASAALQTFLSENL
ncbi:MAG: HPr family phosphocarrier protein [Treponema sp.]